MSHNLGTLDIPADVLLEFFKELDMAPKDSIIRGVGVNVAAGNVITILVSSPSLPSLESENRPSEIDWRSVLRKRKQQSSHPRRRLAPSWVSDNMRIGGI